MMRMKDVKGIKEEDIIEPSKSALATVVARVEQEKKEHDEYLAKKRKYKEFQKSTNQCIPFFPAKRRKIA